MLLQQKCPEFFTWWVNKIFLPQCTCKSKSRVLNFSYHELLRINTNRRTIENLCNKYYVVNVSFEFNYYLTNSILFSTVTSFPFILLISVWKICPALLYNNHLTHSICRIFVSNFNMWRKVQSKAFSIIYLSVSITKMYKCTNQDVQKLVEIAFQMQHHV